jgi:hypothetical protein
MLQEPGWDLSDAGLFEKNKALAYEGQTGDLRRQFCIQYIEHKKRLIGRIGKALEQEAALNGESISCARGCTDCCSSYIAASLQECEAIVYWLYQHEDAGINFIHRYRCWQERIESIKPPLDEIIKFGKLEPKEQAEPERRARFEAAVGVYRLQSIPCPFLKDGACCIYEVRPWACAGVISVSPREWCNASNPNWSRLKTYRLETYAMFERPYYVKTPRPIPLGCLPLMVHSILKKG